MSPLIPNNIEVIPQTNHGSAPISSAQAGDEVLFVQCGKNIIRSMQYSALSETYERRYSMSTIPNIVDATLYIQDSCMAFTSGTGEDNEDAWDDLCVTPDHDVDAPYSTNGGEFFASIMNDSKLLENEVANNKIYIKNTLLLPASICGVSVKVEVGDLN